MEDTSMKKGFCVVIGLLFTLSGGLAYSQEHEPEKVPRGLQGRPPMPMPGAPMGGMGARRDGNDVRIDER
jgi:hypothetical protein